MQAGDLDKRVIIEAPPAASQDSFGDTAPTENTSGSWTTHATRWAFIRPLVGREAFDAMREHADTTHWIRMRYTSGITPRMRVKYGTRIFNILSVANVDEQGRETLLMVKEVLSGGLPTQ